MKNEKSTFGDTGLNVVLQELKENPYRKFRVAFSLMSVIPFLVFLYLLVVKLFTINILLSDIGFLISVCIFLALCGFFVGYNVIKNVLKRLVAYAAQAKHSDQLKSSFVATVSHELNSPLSIVKLNLFNLHDGLLGQINEEQKRVIEVCHNVIERMNRLINDLLDLHKIEAGVVEVRRRLCNLVEIFERQTKEFQIMFNKKHIRLINEAMDKDLSVWADEDKISQVISNLLSNAIKYTPEGGALTLKAYPCEGFVKIECIDTGPGIPPEKLDKIFNKFERLDFTKEGTGLGLAITKDIVELHRGKIWVESKPNEGSKFVVVLPCDLRKTKR